MIRETIEQEYTRMLQYARIKSWGEDTVHDVIVWALENSGRDIGSWKAMIWKRLSKQIKRPAGVRRTARWAPEFEPREEECGRASPEDRVIALSEYRRGKKINRKRKNVAACQNRYSDGVIEMVKRAAKSVGVSEACRRHGISRQGYYLRVG